MSNAINENTTDNFPAVYGRSKGAVWFEHLYKKDVMILGLGGIGSWLALLLSRNGVNLCLYDMDRFEGHNGGQVMFREDVGQLKTVSIGDTIAGFSPDCLVETFGKYGEESETGRIVLTGFDNMDARKLAFRKWAAYVRRNPAEERKYFFFQDGRLLAEQYMIFSIPGDRPDLMERYETEFLYSSEDVLAPKCTYTQTTFMAANITSQMISFLANWVVNAYTNHPPAKVPFFHEYFGVLNLRTNQY